MSDITVSTCMMRVTLLHFAFTPQRVSNVTRRFYVPSVRTWNVYIWVCILSDTTTGGREYVYYIGVLLHVSAFLFGHLQVGIE